MSDEMARRAREMVERHFGPKPAPEIPKAAPYSPLDGDPAMIAARAAMARMEQQQRDHVAGGANLPGRHGSLPGLGIDIELPKSG